MMTRKITFNVHYSSQLSDGLTNVLNFVDYNVWFAITKTFGSPQFKTTEVSPQITNNTFENFVYCLYC